MKIGDKYVLKTKVTDELTAAQIGSGALNVFGTPFLLAQMEKAALTYLNEFIPEGKSTVGTMATVNHTAPSPVGIEVTVEVEVTAISENQKMIDFSMIAYDEFGEIGNGTHQRAVVDAVRFVDKCYARLENICNIKDE